jgi:transaldolase / glucose-6-phosphate isomerase
VQQRKHIATASGYGPRFLHSTGQYHKGGPDTGLFLQITTDHKQDLALPGRPYTFGTFQNAQAAGDLQALHDYNRRTLRVHLGQAGEEAGVTKLLQDLRTALTAE